MTNEEALKFAKEQTYIFGGTMKEFLQFVIDKLEKEVANEQAEEAMREAIRESKCLDEREESIAGRWHI